MPYAVYSLKESINEDFAVKPKFFIAFIKYRVITLAGYRVKAPRIYGVGSHDVGYSV